MLAPKVLVIDDDVAIREAVADALNREGYEIRFSSDGTQALKIINDSCPDVIVLDLRMPGMDGFEFLQKFDRKLSNVCPVIVLTAYADPAIVQACHDAGVGTLLEKPFHLQELREAVRSAVNASETTAPELGQEIGLELRGVEGSRLEHSPQDGLPGAEAAEETGPAR